MTEHHATQDRRGLSRLLAAVLLGAAPGLLLILVAQFVISGEPQLTIGTAGLWLTPVGMAIGLLTALRRKSRSHN